MNTSASTDLLEALLPAWKRRLQACCLDGSLSNAAREALVLAEPPAALQDLLGPWSQGEFSTLPPIVLLPAAAMNGAAGAYAISRRTIVLNADWLVLASPEQVLTVLSEELGHHLDGLLNASDTPGDEGELFAALLDREGEISAEQRQRLLTENDQGSVLVNGEALAVERASVVSTPIAASYPGRTSGETRNSRAFAALKGDGSVVTWGDSSCGGDSSGVADQLSSGVTQIFSNKRAFAALKRDGSVVTWGDPVAGGNSLPVSRQLSSGVTQIFSSDSAFVALKEDGSIVTWGHPYSGGDSSAVTSQIGSGVTQIASTSVAFAALKGDGSVISWGPAWTGGNSSGVADSLSSGVTQIFSARWGFAALKNDGSVVIWEISYNDPSRNQEASLFATGVSKIFATEDAFAALKHDGSVVTSASYSSSLAYRPGVANQLRSGVTKICSTSHSFAALKSDGSVVTWGPPGVGDDSSTVRSLLTDVRDIYSNYGAFAALKSDGSVVSWEKRQWRPLPPGRVDTLGLIQIGTNVIEVVSNASAFAALQRDGSVLTWDFGSSGVDSSAVASQLSSGVKQIVANDSAFAALKDDGTVVTWGDPNGGGDSSSVAERLNNVVAIANPFTDERLVAFDDMLPKISVAVSPAWVPEDGPAKFIFTLTRTIDLSSDLTVNYTVGGSADLDTDYNGIESAGNTKTVTFAEGSSTVVLSVDPAADADVEPDETVSIRIASSPDYRLGDHHVAVGTILNDEPKGYTAGPTSFEGVNLGSTSLGYAYRSADGDPIQVVYPYGYASAGNPGHGWSAVAAAPTSRGTALYWRTTSNGPTARWDLDEHGIYSSGYLLSPFQLQREEGVLNFDINGDGYTSGPITCNGINLGSTSLGYALRRGDALPVQVSSTGSTTTSINPASGWSAVAATTSDRGYALFWRNTGTGQTARWELNSSGAYSSGSLLSPSQLIHEEANLNLDLNGDGIIAIQLGSSSEGYVLVSADEAPIPVTFAGAQASSGTPGNGWNAQAVVVSDAGFSLYWVQDTSHQVMRWNLNVDGSYASSTTISLGELLSTEAKLNFDLNGDGFTSGPYTIADVNLGSSREGYALRTGDAAPIPVTWPQGNASTSSPGEGWSAVAAKPVDDGYALYWRNNGSGQVARWQLNSGGSYQSGTFLSASQLINEELGLNADLNGDSIIGHVASTLESQGRTSLHSRVDGMAEVEGYIWSGKISIPVSSPFNLGVGDSSTEWQMLAAEPIGYQPKILWRNNLGNFLHVWTMNFSWGWNSSYGRINPLSPEALGLESSFQLDLNGDQLIGAIA